MSQAIIKKFRRFVEKAESLLESAIEPLETITVQFNEFVRQASPLVVEDIKRHLPLLAERAALAERWLIRDDLLEVAGYGGVEDAYTELMAWALNPATHPASAVRRQRAWLEVIGVDGGICGDQFCTPETQFVTNDGIPDLVLRFPNGVIVVEAKTGSSEHVTPGGEYFQTEPDAYPKAVRQKLGFKPDVKIEMVFITPDRREARGVGARNTSFIDFALAIASGLEQGELPPEDVKAAYKMLLTHFLKGSSSKTEDVRVLIARISAWSKEQDWESNEHILQRRDDLLAAANILLPERTR